MRIIVALVLAGLASPSFADERELASLVPANVLAYAELRDPSNLAEAWAGWMQGTGFDGTLKTAGDRRDRATEHKHLAAISSLGQIGLLASPEARAELRKLKGAAVALTGFDERGNPEFIAYVLTGDSTVAGLLVRSYLTASPDLRRVATVGGVPLFQHRAPPAPQYDANGKLLPNPPDAAKADEAAMTFASVPGMFVVASRPNLVTGVLKRWEERGKETLADVREFRVDANRKPGSVFAIAFPQRLFAAYADAVRKSGAEADSDWLAWVRFVVQPDAIRTMTASLAAHSDGWELSATFETNPAVSSPLLGLLADRNRPFPVQPEFGLSIALPERKAESLLAFADAVAKAAGVAGRLPSEIVAKAERDTGAKWTHSLLTMLNEISLDLGSRSEPKWKPGLGLSFESSAEAWVAALPGLLRAADPSGQRVIPSEERVGSILVNSYAVRIGPWSAFHVARSGNRMAVATARAETARLIATPERPEKVSAVLVGRLAPEWLVPHDEGKPIPVKPPLALPPTIGETMRQFPPITIAVNRDASSRVTALVTHRGWNGPHARSATTAFASWLEHAITERGIPQNELIPGGFIR